MSRTNPTYDRPVSIPIGEGGEPLGTLSTLIATIPMGGSLSGSVDLAGGRLGAVVMPAGWTAADLTFQVSHDGAAWSDLYDASGNPALVKAAAGRAIALSLADWLAVGRVKLRSGIPAAPVNQGAARDLTLVVVA